MQQRVFLLSVLLGLLVVPGSALLASEPREERNVQNTAGRCVSWSRWRASSGEEQRCYPYRCGDSGCLTACQTTADCAVNAQHRGDWPLTCQRNRCVPEPMQR